MLHRAWSWSFVALFASLSFGCSDDDEPSDTPSATGGSVATGGGSNLPTGGTGGTANPTGGAPSAGGSNTGGAAGASGGSAPEAGAPGSGGIPSTAPPLIEGESPYAIRCGATMTNCGHPDLRCVEIRTSDTESGWACSNQCTGDATCTVSPEGTAPSKCFGFSMRNRCFLSCSESGDPSCPEGMTCSLPYEGATLGYCLWM
jgi:hypothetical protein